MLVQTSVHLIVLMFSANYTVYDFEDLTSPLKVFHSDNSLTVDPQQ